MQRPISRFYVLLMLSVVWTTTLWADPGLRPAPPTTPTDFKPEITIDGDFQDWPDGVTSRADEAFLYFRIQTRETVTLQNAGKAYELRIDLKKPSLPARRTIQDEDVDLTIIFSPPTTRPGFIDHGVRIQHNQFGRVRGFGHHALDIMIAPTFAAKEFELRLNRAKVEAMLERRVDAIQTELVEPVRDTQVRTLSRMTQVRSPARTFGPVEFDLPDREPGSLRILSWNVLWGTAMQKPQPYARVIRALDPDIILLQEWPRRKEAINTRTLRRWVNRYIPLEGGWHILSSDSDVIILSRYPVKKLIDKPLFIEGPQPVRFIPGGVETPLGFVLVGSMHLRCCGGAGGREDITRIREAAAINSFIQSLPPEQRQRIIIGGDINLVGSRTPLDTLAARLEKRNLPLTPANAPVLGDAAFYTWRDQTTDFTPGRLDWLLYSADGFGPGKAFVLDTQRATDRFLTAHTLERTDTDHSDHLPLILDLMPQRER